MHAVTVQSMNYTVISSKGGHLVIFEICPTPWSLLEPPLPISFGNQRMKNKNDGVDRNILMGLFDEISNVAKMLWLVCVFC